MPRRPPPLPKGCRRTSLQLIQGSYIRVYALYGGRVPASEVVLGPLPETVEDGTTELVRPEPGPAREPPRVRRGLTG